MPRLSLCMIVHNEAEFLADCLASVADLVDEIVIADTGSTDDTVAIARQSGAKVMTIAWEDDFALARNQALTQVSGDWVLVLDADERFNQRVKDGIQQAMALENALVVNLLRYEMDSRHSPYSLVSRLFRRHSALRFQQPYHESIDDSALALMQTEPQWQVVDLPGVAIFHQGYSPVLLAKREKTKRAKRLLEKALGANPQDPYLCNKLGSLYCSLGQEKEGLKLLKQGLKRSGNAKMVRFELHYHLANAYRQQQKWELARRHYQKALDEEILLPLKVGALINYAGMVQELGETKEAMLAYQNAIHIDPLQPVAFFNLGLLYKAQGKLPEAMQAYQQAIQLQPDYAEAYQNLGVTAFKAGLLAESLEAFKQAIALYEQQQSPEAEKLKRNLGELGMI